ncbi:ABC transporter ATP-binding protein [Carboxylicivirga sp. M1479]|uniref:ABC transporter ATP-binding protein n=1 Tax=Carboxylicivirga sp. M1479 TaxID=2594476 RepID=UPI001177FF8B|nr:ABC transporter ATP-binding protein [Carboxylicivirga sp. M1479]TRX70611.1 ABC transporter ATP-binding protein [Carboxylicivirga sp. M1479]
MSILKLSNIHKSYADGNNRSNAVLKGLNLEVEEGDFISVKGPSGSGKTTLLSILGTLLLPDEGQYLLNGEDLTSTNADLYKIRNRLIGFVFQDHRLLPQYSALENILLPVLAYQSSAPQTFIDYAHYLMQMTQIEHVANQLPESLSGGESSRVAVCRALIMKPSVLLADEPTGQLDMENAQNIVSLLSEVNKVLNTTVIMVTHSDDMAKAAKRIVTLKNGILQ